MPSVVKGMSEQEFRDLLAPAEAMERIEYDPRRTDAEFRLVDGRHQFMLADTGYQVTDGAYLRLGQLVGIPATYVKKTPFELMVPHVNYWLRHLPGPLGFSATPGQVIELFTKGASPPVSNYTVLDTVRSLLGEETLELRHVSHNPFATTYSILTREEHAVRPGDLVRTGITVENSYASVRPVTVAAYVERLVCTNGAVSALAHYKAARNPGEGLGDWLHDAVERALQIAATDEVEQIRSLTRLSFNGHVSDSLESIFAEFSVPVGIRETIRSRVVEEGLDSLFDLHAIITDIASNDEEVASDPQLSLRLMRIGGKVAAHPSICTQCHRLLV